MRQRHAALATLLLLGMVALLGWQRPAPKPARRPAPPPEAAPPPSEPPTRAPPAALERATDGVVELLLAGVRADHVVPPCSFVQQPDWTTFETRVYPRLIGGPPRLPVPPRWARRALEGVGLRPASVGHVVVDSPWLAHLALRTQVSWDNADGLDRYTEIRGDPAAEAAWWASLHETVQEDPALQAALADHPDPALRDLMTVEAFGRDVDLWSVVADPNADPLLRQAALARGCGSRRPPPPAELAPLFDGAPAAFAMGLAAAALTADPSAETFGWFEREALACRADPPGDPDPHITEPGPFDWARTDGCPNDTALAALRGQLVAIGRATARDWQEALYAAVIACDAEEKAPAGRSTATWRAGWRFERDDVWLACVADHHVAPAPPDGTRIAVTVHRRTLP